MADFSKYDFRCFLFIKNDEKREQITKDNI